MANRVEVVFCGEVIALKSDEDEAHLQRIARYIDNKMAEIIATNVSAAVNERMRTALIAFNVADDYFKTADELEKAAAQLEQNERDIVRLQQKELLIKEKYQALQTEYARLQAEHEEYLELFDEIK